MFRMISTSLMVVGALLLLVGLVAIDYGEESYTATVEANVYGPNEDKTVFRLLSGRWEIWVSSDEGGKITITRDYLGIIKTTETIEVRAGEEKTISFYELFPTTIYASAEAQPPANPDKVNSVMVTYYLDPDNSASTLIGASLLFIAYIIGRAKGLGKEFEKNS